MLLSMLFSRSFNSDSTLLHVNFSHFLPQYKNRLGKGDQPGRSGGISHRMGTHPRVVTHQQLMSQMRVASSITAVHIHTEPRKNVHNEKCLLLRQMCVHCKHAIRHVLKRADDKLMYTYYKPKYVHMCNVCPGLELCVIIALLHKNMSSLPPSSPETPCILCGLLHDA